MTTKLERIINEFNPWHDFDNIQYHPLPLTETLPEKWKYQKKFLTNLLMSAKPLGRGLLVGSAFGLLANTVSDNPLFHDLKTGASFGSFIDFHQFMYRSAYHYLRAQIYQQPSPSK